MITDNLHIVFNYMEKAEIVNIACLKFRPYSAVEIRLLLLLLLLIYQELYLDSLL